MAALAAVEVRRRREIAVLASLERKARSREVL